MSGAVAEEKETGRIEAFSDGVFAIAITLLILEIKVPHLSDGSGESLARALASQWPSYTAFGLSFFTILIMWANHHTIFRYLRGSNAALLYANGLLLLLVTFVPYPTSVLAEYLDRPGGAFAGVFYAGTFVAIAVAFNLVWWIARRGPRLLKAGVPEAEIRRLTRSYLPGVPLYLAATAAAFIDVRVTVGICMALAIFFMFTGRGR